MPVNVRRLQQQISDHHAKLRAEALALDRRKVSAFFAEQRLDLTALYRLHSVDLFVYADTVVPGDAFEKQLGIVAANPSNGVKLALRFPNTARLREVPVLAPFFDPPDREPVDTRMWLYGRTVGGVATQFWILWVGAPASDVFKVLFANQNAAPRYLGLPPTTAEYASWTGELARLVQGNLSVEPEFILTRNVLHDWPWAQVWLRFKGWLGTVMYALCKRRPTLPPTVRPAGARTVVAKHARLTPDTIGNAKAACISIQAYEQYEWPPEIRIFVDAPDTYQPDARTLRLNPHCQFLKLSGLPLESALKALQEFCNGYDTVAVNPLGYDGDGAGWLQWQATPGQPTTLVIHCELPGELEAVAPYATRIE